VYCKNRRSRRRHESSSDDRAGILGAVAVAFAANAEEISRQNFKVIGLSSATPPSIFDEVPFWRETLPAVSKAS